MPSLSKLHQHLSEAAFSKIVLDAQRSVEASDIPDDEEEYDDDYDEEDMEDGDIDGDDG
jgi:hypothetical protein